VQQPTLPVDHQRTRRVYAHVLNDPKEGGDLPGMVG
jgi:hypothetical protein